MPTGRTLLLADDSPTIQKVVSLTFEDEGLSVVAVGSGGEALARIEQDAPDIILADVHMPAPAGYELCARVKRDERLRHVPVLLLVGAFEPYDEAEARACGADGVLTKPFQSIRELVSKVGGLLGGNAGPKTPDDGADTRADERAETDSDDVWGAHRAPARATAEAAPQAADAPAFAGYDLDDEGIETVPADSFAAQLRADRVGDETSESLQDETPDAEAPVFALENSRSFAPGGARGLASEARGFAPDEARGVTTEEARGFAPDEARSFAAAASGFHPPAPSAAAHAPAAPFDSRAASAAEDSLLELDDFASPAPAAESDDFILDFDAGPSFERRPHAPSEAAPAAVEASPATFEAAPVELEDLPVELEASPAPEAASAHAVEAADAGETASRGEASAAVFAEPSAFADSPDSRAAAAAGDEDRPAHISPANLSSAWKEPEPFATLTHADAQSDAAPHGFDPVPSAFEAVSEAFEEEPVAVFDEDVTEVPGEAQRRGGSVLHDEWQAESASITEAPTVAATQAPPVTDAATAVATEAASATAEASQPTEASQPGAASVASVEASQAGGAQLSDEAIDAIARRVVEHLSERVLREIAWEVVPDLAERLIRQRLEEEKLK